MLSAQLRKSKSDLDSSAKKVTAAAEHAPGADTAPPAAASSGGGGSGGGGSGGGGGGGDSFVTIKTFGWDQGAYDSPTVSVYVSADMAGVGALAKESVKCDFTPRGFDLRVLGLRGKSYRLLKDSLGGEIVPGSCKVSVRADRLTVKLRKKKGEYSYENWTDLASKKSAKEETDKAKGGKGADPMGGIMDMMKDMYDKGDDSMKKTIGEAMMKSRQKDGGMDAMGGGGDDDLMGGLGGGGSDFPGM